MAIYIVSAALAVVKLGIRSLTEGSCTCLGVYHRYKESFLYIDGVHACAYVLIKVFTI